MAVSGETKNEKKILEKHLEFLKMSTNALLQKTVVIETTKKS